MPETIHCRVKGCGQPIHAKNFEDGMAKLRRHRAKNHPTLFKRSVKKAVATKKARR